MHHGHAAPRRNGSKCVFFAAAAAAAVLTGAQTAQAQIQTAGDLLINLRADNPTAGTAAWTNTGSLGGAFTEVGDPAFSNEVPGYVRFDPNEGYRGPTAPADVTGSSNRSIEVWVKNPVLSGEDSMVAWGHRGGPDASNLAFNYGSSNDFGAVGHWGPPDLGWNGPPAADTLHHLVYTYDGTTARVYSDGVLKNSDAVALNTHALVTDTINLIAQNNAGGGLEFIDSNGMDIAVVRVHGGALSDQQIIDNFNAGVGADVPEPAALGLLGLGGLGLLARRRRR